MKHGKGTSTFWLAGVLLFIATTSGGCGGKSQDATSSSAGQSTAPVVTPAGSHNLVAVDPSGRIMTYNGAGWTPLQTEVLFNSAITTGTSSVAVGSNGTIFISIDGKDWTATRCGTSSWLYAVAQGNDKTVATGADGTVAVSGDGIAWSEADSGTTETLYGVTYGNNRFVAVGSAGAVLISADGMTWRKSVQDEEIWMNAVAYGNGRFVAVADGGTVFSSENGADWTETDQVMDDDINSIAFGNNRFVAIGRWGEIAISGDGLTWNKVQQSLDGLTTVQYCDAGFVALRDDGAPYLSTDGVAWSN